ncbi:hypothetical protein [Burkholderia sp. ABCPW 11]|uniref:hypothetical protein n=1 Tax=Burkholderia sp. ABCPW 11 TaxID=1637859 RepID=UPI0015D05C4A|nr:hypothetical protein [Burkholderia sp. ABCPW 11]
MQFIKRIGNQMAPPATAPRYPSVVYIDGQGLFLAKNPFTFTLLPEDDTRNHAEIVSLLFAGRCGAQCVFGPVDLLNPSRGLRFRNPLNGKLSLLASVACLSM